MPKFKFTSISIIQADTETEAKVKFANNAFNFAANAKCEEIKDEDDE